MDVARLQDKEQAQTQEIGALRAQQSALKEGKRTLKQVRSFSPASLPLTPQHLARVQKDFDELHALYVELDDKYSKTVAEEERLLRERDERLETIASIQVRLRLRQCRR